MEQFYLNILNRGSTTNIDAGVRVTGTVSPNKIYSHKIEELFPTIDIAH